MLTRLFVSCITNPAVPRLTIFFASFPQVQFLPYIINGLYILPFLKENIKQILQISIGTKLLRLLLPDTKIKHKNEKWIEDNISYGTNNNRNHSCRCISLCINEWIHSCCNHGRKSSNQINHNIWISVYECIFRSTKRIRIGRANINQCTLTRLHIQRA